MAKLHFIDHIAIVVDDLVGCTQFFEDIGFTRKHQDKLQGPWIDAIVNLQDVEAEFVVMSLAESQANIELLKFHNPRSNQKISQVGSLAANIPGFRHVAIAVEDIDAWHDKVTNMGLTVLSEVRSVPNFKGKRLFYFRGPEGFIVELAEYAGQNA